MSTREIQLEHFEHLVSAYAALSAYASRSQELEDRIEQAFKEAAAGQPTMDGVSTILGRRRRPWEMTQHRAAWFAQHVFQSRAFCVGNQLLSQRREDGSNTPTLRSPLVDQIALCSGTPEAIDLAVVEDELRRCRAKRVIDAVLLDRPSRRAIVLKAAPLSASRTANRQPRAVAMTAPLFSHDTRELTGLYASTRDVAALWGAKEVISAAYPDIQCEAIFAVMDDTPASRGFQFHALTDVGWPEPNARSVCLDGYRVISSSLDWRRGGHDLDLLDTIPAWLGTDCLFNMPVDRTTRCLMVLSTLWTRQRGQGSLRFYSKASIAREVGARYNLVYTQDLRRHDIEDCLERGGYVERPLSGESRFALTPLGVARIVLFRRLANPINDADLDHGFASDVLAHIATQAALWRDYRDGLN